MANVEFIPFEKKYIGKCVALFESNLTGYFSPEEVKDFVSFLENLTSEDHYYLGLLDERIVACGGWDKQPKGYYLRWGIIDNQRHQQGLGRQLLQFRIDKIYQLFGNVDIYIKTSDKAHGFFKKFGFEVCKVIANGIFEGIDEYQMLLSCRQQKNKGQN